MDKRSVWVMGIGTLILLSACRKQAPALMGEQTITTTTTTQLQTKPATTACTTTSCTEEHAVAGNVLQDEAAMEAWCDEICHQWARRYEGDREVDFAAVTEYDGLNTYMKLAAEKCVLLMMSSGEDVHFEAKTYGYEGDFAMVEGIYKGDDGGYGGYLFILRNVDGEIKLNDFIMKTMDSADTICRIEFMQHPTPDFWRSEARAEAAITQLQALS